MTTSHSKSLINPESKRTVYCVLCDIQWVTNDRDAKCALCGNTAITIVPSALTNQPITGAK